MKKMLTILCIIIGMSVCAYAVPCIEIKSADEETHFSGKKQVLIQKGDRIEYREPGFDDSTWQTVSLPSKWFSLYPGWKQVCWYRIHFCFSEILPDKSYGIELGVISDVDEVYLNGSLIGKSGSFPPNRKSSYDKKRFYELPASLIRQGRDNVVAIRIAGLFDDNIGPYKGNFRVAPFSRIQKDILFTDIFNLIFIVIYLVFAVYFFAFFVRRPMDRENLFFSLYTLGTSGYLLMITQFKHHFGLDFHLMKKLEYLMLSLLFVFVTEFITFYFKKKHRVWHYINIAVAVTVFMLILFSGNYLFWQKVNYYVLQTSWLILSLPIVFYTLVTKVKSDVDARYMLVTIFILVLAVLNDMLVVRGIYNFIYVTNYGFLVFIGGLAAILNNRFIRLYHEVEDLNINLEVKVGERTAELNSAMHKIEDANTQIRAARDELWGEMQLAKKIQTSLLPKEPRIPGYEIAAYMAPAAQVGGDYYDIINIGDYDWLVIGDVSGHGVPAGLVMMMVQTSIHTVLLEDPNVKPEVLISRVNSVITRNMKKMNEDKYMTITVIACIKDGQFYYAGLHLDILIFRRSSKSVEKVKTDGLWIGLMDNIRGQTKDSTLQLDVGDTMMLYTDGVVEAWEKEAKPGQRFPETDMYGINRLTDIFKSSGELAPKKIIDLIISDLTSFIPFDDVTLVIVKRLE